ncbi:MAG TPA: hypothetical protein VFL57_14845 [Bryobacteraceae bacterium]|nr:hypothetical protein [Bryobacteraceae bacterium]
MLNRILLMLCAFAGLATAVDTIGTWKLNTAKSKYTGMPMPKELTATYTPEGSGWRYEGKGTLATGEPINASFTYTKDGEEIRATGFPMWDAMILQNASAAKATGTLKRAGKTVGSVTRLVSADGKTMTIRGNVMTPEGKKASFTSVYEKQ